MTARFYLWLFCLLLLFALKAMSQALLENHNFQLMERVYNETKKGYEYVMRNVTGTERANNSLNRLSIISENQFDYPFPESGCGPTALLNIIVWYEKYGLIEPYGRAADGQTYKRNLFEYIDGRFTTKSGFSRAELSGTSIRDAVLVLDELVKDGSEGRYRIHSEYIEAPLALDDFLSVMPNFRAGYLVAQPRSPQTGKLQQLHALTLIRADRSGYLTLATWGEVYRGLLRKRADGQWFIPSNTQHLEMKIVGLLKFIPFEPQVVEVSSQ